VVARIDLLQVAGGCLDLQTHFDDTAFRLARLRKAGVLEDAEHRLVFRADLGDEALDPASPGELRELLEQTRSDAMAL
jgi:hypothetical protein